MSNCAYAWWGFMQNICHIYPQPNRTTQPQEREVQAVSKAISETPEEELALLRRCLIGCKGSVKSAAAEMGVDEKTAMRWQKRFTLTVAKHFGLLE